MNDSVSHEAKNIGIRMRYESQIHGWLKCMERETVDLS